MSRCLFVLFLPLLLTAGAATALVEPKSGVTYPDSVVIDTPVGPATLIATGAGLREKSFLKKDVYTIVSYVHAATDLGADPVASIRTLNVPKRLQLDMRRDVGREKLEATLTKAIATNVEDLAPIAADLETFFSFFTDDARESDCVVIEYVPGIGLTTSLNGEVKGVIDSFTFVTALWSVWFGQNPQDDQLVRALVSQVAP
jgi:hypothetical protein